jgi:glucose/arabinose dehydrogenase
MQSKLLAAFLIASALLATPAMARSSVPVVNYENVSVPSSSDKVPTAAEVKQAILAAAEAKGWSIAQQPDGKLLATLKVRNKHAIVVEISYAGDQYSLTYKESINMNYAERDGEQLIHPHYNKWTQELIDAIHIEMLNL